jgi:hypothetical protein
MSTLEDSIALWRQEGLSDAEIGRRLGVSADRLREIAHDPAHDDAPEADDNTPNHADIR